MTTRNINLSGSFLFWTIYLCAKDFKLIQINSTMNYDLVVLGSGPGGYVAAIRAAQ